MVPLVLLGLLAGCDALPRDLGGTSERIARERVVRVGLAGPETPAARRFLAALAGETGARIVRRGGSLEPLVEALDREQLDLLIAPVRANSLLAGEIALGPPLDGSRADDRPLAERPAVRNGESRWLMTVERVARGPAGR